VVALSTTEAEYVAATHATKEATWLCAFLGELTEPSLNPTMLYCDNQVAITLSLDNHFHASMKHIDILFHFIHEAVENGTITLIYFPTATMTADIFTKPLPCLKIETHHMTLGLLLP